MRNMMLILSGVCLFSWCLVPAALAQDEKPSGKLFVVHEDIAKPSMLEAYEKAATGVVKAIAENEASGLDHVVAMTDDFHYLYISEIENMAALDNNPWAALRKKIGKEAMDKVWGAYEGTYESHRNYIVRSKPEFSYDPGGAKLTDSETPFRHWDFYYIQPNMGDEAREVSKEWKALYENKGIKNGYRIYTGGMGTETPLYIVVRWAKDAADYAAQIAEEDKMLGEEAQALGQKTMAITRRIVRKDGRMRPDLSYMPQPMVSAK